MKMKKRRVRDFLLAGSLILGMMLTGCGMSGQQTEQSGGKEQNKVEKEKISVVATIFPQYDFVRQIAGENVELKMLLKPGEETHSYEPTPSLNSIFFCISIASVICLSMWAARMMPG